MADDQDDRFPSERMERFIVRMPDGMREMIREAADANGRSMNAEIVVRLGQSFANWPPINIPIEFYDRAVNSPMEIREKVEKQINDAALRILEEAYPAPRQPGWPFHDLRIHVLQWYSDAWHPVDWDAWTRFRADEETPTIERRMTEAENYFVVLVFDEYRMIRNIIPHNYVLRNGKFVSAAFERLNEEERQEYNRYMTAITDTKQDRQRIRELRRKMDPALSLPPALGEKLREMLKGLTDDDTLDMLLKQVS
ncbi:Arc family DNA-binding protein [Aquamicrobium soli]|uniref:Arc family DNA-binding protein n=1 Tax=Aquamicrobium soli TaxID=1811518 RepID=A0ABV7KD18_9HYPH